MSEQVKGLFSNIAPTYDLLNHLLTFNIDKRWRKSTIRSIRAERENQVCALDLCAGTLDLSVEFLKTFPHARCHAVDFSELMLQQGIKKVSLNLKERIQIHCADALKLPFPDNHFDLIFCGFGLRNLDDPIKGIKEMRRVLKIGGQLLLLEFFLPVRWVSRLFHQTYGKWVLPLLGRWVSKREEAYRYLHDSILNFYSVDSCKKVIEKQNFIDIECKDFFMGVSSLISAFKS